MAKILTEREKDTLKNIYYNIKKPGSFGGLNALQRYTKIPQKKIQAWIEEQDTYTLHKSVRRHVKKERILVNDIDHQWEADLVSLNGISKSNRDYKFLLTVIDVLSKYAWVVPMKDKTGESIIKAFQTVLRSGRKPFQLRTDKGSEFLNRKFQALLREKKIHYFTATTDVKASVVERFNRTLKNKMWKYFTAFNTRKYIDILDDLTHTYNHSYHRSIKRTPAEVNAMNAQEVWKTLYGKWLAPSKKYKFQLGETVRISKLKRHFEKGYLPNWTKEIFLIHKQLMGPKYRLTDLSGEDIEGTFMESELQRVRISENKTYNIEKIIQRRGRGKNAEVLVKWEGYPNKFNSWIPASELKDI